MDLIILVLVASVIGFLVYLITEKIPMDPMFKMSIRLLALIVLVLWIFSRFGFKIPNVM
jgi:hypothetical protein